MKNLNLLQTAESVYLFLVERVRQNLRIVLCFSPIGDEFRYLWRSFYENFLIAKQDSILYLLDFITCEVKWIVQGAKDCLDFELRRTVVVEKKTNARFTLFQRANSVPDWIISFSLACSINVWNCKGMSLEWPSTLLQWRWIERVGMGIFLCRVMLFQWHSSADFDQWTGMLLE